jgi:5,10-methylenetetrahydromethanopterin reductase
MTDIDITVGLPPTQDSAHHIAIAERLGYAGAYLFDTPFEGDDVWHQLHRAADLTSTIELGPGVLIPTQRHPLVNAAQTISLHQLAPGRVSASFGTGFSSRAAIGQPPIRWSYMEDYINAYTALLAGCSVEWEGAPIKLLLPRALSNELPLSIPLLVSAIGPRGTEAAKGLGADGLISMFQIVPRQTDFDRAVVVVFGTVLDPGEKLTDERVRRAAGPPWGGMFHFVYTSKGSDAVREMPGGLAWLEVIEKVPERERHLAIHQGHMLEMNDADLAAWNAGGYASLPEVTITGSAKEVRSVVEALAEQGATEVMLQPSGPDIPRELESFIAAVR